MFTQLRSTLQARTVLHIKPGPVSASWLRFGAVAAWASSWQEPATKQQLTFQSTATSNNSPQTLHKFGAVLTAAFKRQWQKQGSEHGKSKPTPSWLANLTVLGVGAVVVAANTEQVPISGRRQFTLWFLHTPSLDRSSSGHLPAVAELHRHDLDNGSAFHELQEQGLQLMQNSYQTAASGVARLAASDTILQKRLKMLPKRIVLQHDARDVFPQATMKLITENQKFHQELWSSWLHPSCMGCWAGSSI